MVASIEYVERVIENFQKATELNLDSPTRVGSHLRFTADDAEEVMIAGDLHGHRRNFNLIRRVAALDKHPRRHLVLQEVCHGGSKYPENGGCMSHAMLEDVAKLTVQFPERVHFLMGNHELAEMTDYPIQKNKKMLNLLFRLGLQQMYGPAAEKIREAFVPFLRSCPLAVRLPNGVFVSHSIPENVDTKTWDATLFSRTIEPAEFFQRNGIFQLLWGRDYRQENADAFAELIKADVLINGHEPCPEGFSVPNSRQVILDCCTGSPCCVILPVGSPVTQEEVVGRIQKLS